MPANTVSDPSLLTNAQTPQTLQAWTNLLDSIFPPSTNTSGSSSGTTTSSTLQQTSSEANDPIKALLAMLIPGSMGGIDNPQSKALIQNLLTQFKEGAGGLSGIQAAGNSAGVYNSSTQGLLANDAMSRAIAAAAGTIGTQQNQQQNIIAQLLATLSAGSRTTGTSQVETNNTNTSSTVSKSGGGGSTAGKALLGAGAAAAAAKAIKDAFGGSGLKSGQGRQDDQDDTSGMPKWTDPNGESKGDQEGDYPQGSGTSIGDVGAELGTDFPPDSDSADPFGVGGFDIGDFTANDQSSPNFDFIDFSEGNQSGDVGGDLGTDFEDDGGGGDSLDFGGEE